MTFRKTAAIILTIILSANISPLAYSQENRTSTHSIKYSYSSNPHDIIIKTDGISISGRFYTIKEFESLLNKAVLIADIGGNQTRVAIAAGIYFIPGIGEIAIAATGAIVVAGATVAVGSWLYKTITNWLNDSAKQEIARVKGAIPSRLRNSDGNVDLSKFKDKIKGKNAYREKGGWTIDKDTAGHGGRKWKLKNKNGNRIASLGSNGEVLGK